VTRLKEKVAIITGGSRGIGAATARRFAAEGAAVIITARSSGPGLALVEELAADGGTALFIPQDVTFPDDWSRVISSVEDEFGALHVLVNNAGIHLGKPFLDYTLEDFDRIVAMNLRSVFIGMQKALPLMIQTAGKGTFGSIINVSSTAATSVFPGENLYEMTKGGLHMLTKSTAKDFGFDGIPVRVNTVNPAIVETEMTQEYIVAAVASGDYADEASVRAELLKPYPFGRFALPEDVANTILFLASDEAAYVTGGAFFVDGAESV
jgi:NAD(P)-dependent dehydrogenase (short-subunit alcohol dehydrogenase family)